MAEIGVSTSCFYPLETEKSFLKLAKAGVSCTEIFFNSPSETEDRFLSVLRGIRDSYGMKIVSVHPYMSFAEGFFLFSSYERRYTDMLSFYERFFEITSILGAKYFIFHGAKLRGSVEKELYFERFARLTELGKQHGVQVCQENVVHYRSEDPAFLMEMAQAVGEDFGVVLDIKQARRAGFDYVAFTALLSRYIRHIHISDSDESNDCITPGEGNFDFSSFFAHMQKTGYDGTYMIELYQDSYKDENDITKAYKTLKKILP